MSYVYDLKKKNLDIYRPEGNFPGRRDRSYKILKAGSVPVNPDQMLSLIELRTGFVLLSWVVVK